MKLRERKRKTIKLFYEAVHPHPSCNKPILYLLMPAMTVFQVCAITNTYMELRCPLKHKIQPHPSSLPVQGQAFCFGQGLCWGTPQIGRKLQFVFGTFALKSLCPSPAPFPPSQFCAFNEVSSKGWWLTVSETGGM